MITLNTPFLSFDLETTGTDPNTDRIVTSSLVFMDPTNGDIHDKTYIADPGVTIPQEAAQVHGYTTTYVQQHGQPHHEVLRDTADTLTWAWDHDMPVVVYNAAFDLSMVTALDPSFQVDGLVIDPFIIDKAIDPYRKGRRTLTQVADHYGISLDNAHSSSADSIAAGRLAWVLVQNVLPQCTQRVPNPFGDTRGYTFAESLKDEDLFMDMQKRCAYVQKTSLAKYLRKQGKLVDIDTGFPVQDSTMQRVAASR